MRVESQGVPTWYIRYDYQRHDIHAKAQLSADATGQPQLILAIVPEGEQSDTDVEEFDEFWREETTIEPNLRRRFAGLYGECMPWETA